MSTSHIEFSDSVSALAKPPVSAGKRLLWIESLRGLAVVAVVQYHLFPDHAFAFLGSGEKYIHLGDFGVILFFLISGFVIPYSVTKLADHAAIRFPVARVFRLYPAYWVSLIPGALIYHPSWANLLVNLTMLQRFVGQNDVIGVYWTLQVELIFYAVIEAALLLGRIKSRSLYPILAVVFALLAIVAGLGRFYLDRKLPVAPQAGLAVMFAGTVYFMHVRSAFLSKAKMFGFAAFIYSLLGVAFLFAYRKDWGYHESPHRFFAMYLASAVVFALFSWKEFSHPVLNFLGRISYPVYLLHLPIKLFLGPALFSAQGYFYFAVLLLSASTALHYWVEKPFLKLGHRAIKRMVD